MTPTMNISFPVEPATFLERPNRFVIHARLHGSGAQVRAHCPNPGRMRELMITGATVYVDKATDPTRRTPYTLRFIEHPANGQLISLNTQLPNDLFAEGLGNGFFAPFIDYTNCKREVIVLSPTTTDNQPKSARINPNHENLRPPSGRVTSRIDFRLSAADGRVCWVETKSATLVHDDGCAFFPDAPTVRGRRHVEELTHLVGPGVRAAVVFIIQRPDAISIAPNRETDPAFADALSRARARGVELYAYTCGVTTSRVWLEREVPVVTGS
ncbi:MAG: DNA/RNA nuclease SfsA [Chloroflexi bacterium]|nr:DNA/RNA nuclease SfsA [Chloroflexota bacterium]